MSDTPRPDPWSTPGSPSSPSVVRGGEDADGDRRVPHAETVDIGDAPAPGWWLASDGRYYPPELAPGRPAPLPSGAPPSPGGPAQPRQPVYKRAWFWIVIGLGTLMTGVVIALILFGILIWSIPIDPSTPPGAASPPEATDAPEASGLVVLESTDFTAEPEGTERTGDEWSAVVSGGELRISATRPGATYPSWTALDGADEARVTSTMRWPEGALAGDEFLLIGVMVLDHVDDGGYGLACGNDGSVYTLLIGPTETVVMGSTAEPACLDDEFTLSLGVLSGVTTDIVSAEIEGGESSVTTPGTVLGPFTDAGFVMASGDESITVPGMAVRSLEVQVAE